MKRILSQREFALATAYREIRRWRVAATAAYIVVVIQIAIFIVGWLIAC